jgi:hypothetical protein
MKLMRRTLLSSFHIITMSYFHLYLLMPQYKTLTISKCPSHPSSAENETSPRHALSYSTSNHATPSSDPTVYHIEEPSNNSQAILEDTGNTTDSCSAVSIALNNGLRSKALHTPLTSSVIQQHNIGNSRLNRNPTTQYYFREAAAHLIECGAAAVDISLPPGLDAEFALAYDSAASLQRGEASATDQTRGNAALEEHIHEFCIELDNDSLTYQTVEHLDAHLYQHLTPEAHARYPVGRPNSYVDSLPWIGEISHEPTAWGNDLAGVGTHFMEDYKGKSRD